MCICCDRIAGNLSDIYWESITQIDCTRCIVIRHVPILPRRVIELKVSHNVVTLPSLPRGLLSLCCSGSKIGWLPTLPECLVELFVDGTEIMSIPTLPTRLKILNCSYTPLTELPALPPRLEVLYCVNTAMLSIPYTGARLYSNVLYRLPHRINARNTERKKLSVDIDKDLTILAKNIKILDAKAIVPYDMQKKCVPALPLLQKVHTEMGPQWHSPFAVLLVKLFLSEILQKNPKDHFPISARKNRLSAIFSEAYKKSFSLKIPTENKLKSILVASRTKNSTPAVFSLKNSYLADYPVIKLKKHVTAISSKFGLSEAKQIYLGIDLNKTDVYTHKSITAISANTCVFDDTMMYICCLKTIQHCDIFKLCLSYACLLAYPDEKNEVVSPIDIRKIIVYNIYDGKIKVADIPNFCGKNKRKFLHKFFHIDQERKVYEKSPDCAICYESQQNTRDPLRCGHWVCDTCKGKIQTCPMCREAV